MQKNKTETTGKELKPEYVDGIKSVVATATTISGVTKHVLVTTLPDGSLHIEDLGNTEFETLPKDELYKLKIPKPKKILPSKICPVCGESFIPSRKDQIYNSDSCASRARMRKHRKRKKESVINKS